MSPGIGLRWSEQELDVGVVLSAAREFTQVLRRTLRGIEQVAERNRRAGALRFPLPAPPDLRPSSLSTACSKSRYTHSPFKTNCRLIIAHRASEPIAYRN